MSGKIIILPENSLNFNNINKHDHVDIILNNNTIIRYHDPRRFGAILWTTEDPYNHFLLNHLGPEPFDKTFSSEYLFKKAHKKLLPIKQFIMDNKIVVGIGNIYANEALFAAKINPLCITKNLNLIQFDSLIKSIKIILKTAIAKGGTTLKDFCNINGEPGYFAQTLQVYGRYNKPCLICNAIISEIKIGQRSTFFCNICQPISQNI
jgi:formamidopyrimidine-DNA glycosylase